MIHRRALLQTGLILPLAAPFLSPAAAATPAGGVLRVGDQKGGTRSVMTAAGVLDGLPFRLEWSQFPAASPVLEALNAGAIDLAYAGDAPATLALAAGLPARVVAPVRTTGAGTAIMVSKSSKIRTAADLKGRRIAANRGSIGYALVLALAEREGWGAGDYTVVNLMPSDAKAALSAGAVDAWSSWGIYVAQARLADGARVVVDGGQDLLVGLSFLLATDRAIGTHRPELIEFCRRLATARRWALGHPDGFARVLAAETGVEEPVARLVVTTDATRPVPIDDAVVADEQAIADLFLKARLLPGHLDARTMFDLSFNQALSG